MLTAAIALNRFGLGARPISVLSDDPRKWLLDQLAEFQPRPSALANVPARRQVVAQLADYLGEARMDRRAKGDVQPASMPTGADAAAPNAQKDPLRRYLRQSIRDDYVAMNSARLDSALTTETPFIERLVHF